MTLYEFGKENKKSIVLIHPSAVMWNYFEYVIPLLEKNYHVIIPALPGYDKEHSKECFTSVEEIASQLADWLNHNGHPHVELLYGCSMGGSIVLRMLADQKVHVDHAVVDGGITPYQLPWIVTRLIAVRDFLMISMGKIGGLKLLEKAFSTDAYSAEDLKYLADVLHFMTYKTIWRTFESCNNYAMPNKVLNIPVHIQYWYGTKEEKDRKWDIQYMKKHFPKTEFMPLKDMGHGSMASLHPQEMKERFVSLIEKDGLQS